MVVRTTHGPVSHASAAKIETIYLWTISCGALVTAGVYHRSTSAHYPAPTILGAVKSLAALFLCLHLHMALKLREARKHGQLTSGLIVKAGNCPVFYSKKSVDVSVQWISIELFLLHDILLWCCKLYEIQSS